MAIHSAHEHHDAITLWQISALYSMNQNHTAIYIYSNMLHLHLLCLPCCRRMVNCLCVCVEHYEKVNFWRKEKSRTDNIASVCILFVFGRNTWHFVCIHYVADLLISEFCFILSFFLIGIFKCYLT